jgi:hypothetical protein
VGVGQRVNCSPEGSTSPSGDCDTRPHAAPRPGQQHVQCHMSQRAGMDRRRQIADQ